MRIYILLILIAGSLLNACAQVQINYSTKSKKAIKLFEKARNAPSQSQMNIQENQIIKKE